MPRNVAIIKTAIWESGSDFRALTENAQWTYLMLISQRQINTCGVLSYTPERWQHLSGDTKRGRVVRGLNELAAERYVIVDEKTGELLVRTFVRHDQVWKKPNLVSAARSQFKEILSDTIRSYLASAHPWIADERLPVSEGVPEPVPEGATETPSQTPSETPPRTRARAQARPPASRLPSPKPEPSSLSAVRSELPPNGLPIDKELFVARLLNDIGPDQDIDTSDVVRALAARLPFGSLVKVHESLLTNHPDDRAAYAVGALKSELEELHA